VEMAQLGFGRAEAGARGIADVDAKSAHLSTPARKNRRPLPETAPAGSSSRCEKVSTSPASRGIGRDNP
jgi:hypothetical protein